MTQDVKTPLPGVGRGVFGSSLRDGLDGSENKPPTIDLQAVQRCRAATAARETHIAEIWALCSELVQHAEIACGYASIGNERGLRYAVNCIVDLAIRAGDEALALRQKSAEARAIEAERLSAARQGGGAQ
jgi:hypothetical protein